MSETKNFLSKVYFLPQWQEAKSPPVQVHLLHTKPKLFAFHQLILHIFSLLYNALPLLSTISRHPPITAQNSHA